MLQVIRRVKQTTATYLMVCMVAEGTSSVKDVRSVRDVGRGRSSIADLNSPSTMLSREGVTSRMYCPAFALASGAAACDAAELTVNVAISLV